MKIDMKIGFKSQIRRENIIFTVKVLSRQQKNIFIYHRLEIKTNEILFSVNLSGEPNYVFTCALRYDCGHTKPRASSASSVKIGIRDRVTSRLWCAMAC